MIVGGVEEGEWFGARHVGQRGCAKEVERLSRRTRGACMDAVCGWLDCKTRTRSDLGTRCCLLQHTDTRLERRGDVDRSREREVEKNKEEKEKVRWSQSWVEGENSCPEMEMGACGWG